MAPRAGRFRGTPAPEPDGEIRASQVVTQFGPGALVDLLHDAALVSGLDHWRYDGEQPELIQEPRLRDALVERLRRRDIELDASAPFRAPPVQKDDPSRRQGITVVEFPRWVVCQNPRCRALVKATELERAGDKYLHRCAVGQETASCVPVRFLMACKRGHIDEFHWVSFAHQGEKERVCTSPRLTLEQGRTGDFRDLRVVCKCGERRPLSNAMSPDANPTCSGRRPWLGAGAKEACDQKLRLLVRTASNSYFAQVESALSLPIDDDPTRARVAGLWDILGESTRDDLPVFLKPPKVRSALAGLSEERIWEAIEDIRQSQGPREQLRTAELKRFLSQPIEKPGELPDAGATFFARVLADQAPTRIERVIIAPKLREVRVQVGFTRLEAVSPDLEGEYSLDVETAMLGKSTRWLPATEVRGEGVLLQLRENELRAWESREDVRARGQMLLGAFESWKKAENQSLQFPGLRFYLLHSLSHLLINAVSLECGYPASSIRERIYCSVPGQDVPMAAILLMTGTPGAEGTLGGLVEQGRRLGHHLQAALELGRLCSNDPVCALHRPGDPSDRLLEGAACHGCLFIAESSCERFNRFLDRALVVPVLGVESVAFWGGEG